MIGNFTTRAKSIHDFKFDICLNQTLLAVPGYGNLLDYVCARPREDVCLIVCTYDPTGGGSTSVVTWHLHAYNGVCTTCFAGGNSRDYQETIHCVRKTLKCVIVGQTRVVFLLVLRL